MSARALRLALTASTVLSSLALSGAVAAPGKARPTKPVCQLVSDEKGDTVAYPPAGPAVPVPVPDADGDDILSADVASDRTTITAVVRPAVLAATDPRAPFGRNYYLEFGLKGSTDLLFLAVRTYPTGSIYSSGVHRMSADGTLVTTRLDDATGTADLAKGEVRISVPLRAFARAKVNLAVGHKITAVRVLVARNATPLPSQDAAGQRVPTGTSVALDEAFGADSYVLGTPSCVPVGR